MCTSCLEIDSSREGRADGEEDKEGYEMLDRNKS